MTWHVAYADGTFGEAKETGEDEAAQYVEEMLSGPSEMLVGAIRGEAPAGAVVSISTFGSER